MSRERSTRERREEPQRYETSEADERGAGPLDPESARELELYKYHLFAHRTSENVDTKARDARDKPRGSILFNNVSTVGNTRLQITGRTLYASKSLIADVQEATFTGARSKAKSKTAQCVRMRISDYSLSEGVFSLGLHVRPGASRSGKLKEAPEGCIAAIDIDLTTSEEKRHGREILLRKCCCTPHPHFFLWASTGEWILSLNNRQIDVPFFVGSNGLGRHGTNTLKAIPVTDVDPQTAEDGRAQTLFQQGAALVVAREEIPVFIDGHLCFAAYSPDQGLLNRALEARLSFGAQAGAVQLFVKIVRRNAANKIFVAGTIPLEQIQFLPQEARLVLSQSNGQGWVESNSFFLVASQSATTPVTHENTQSPSSSHPHSYTSGDDYSASTPSDLSPVAEDTWFYGAARDEISEESSSSGTGSTAGPGGAAPFVYPQEQAFYPVDDDIVAMLEYWQGQKNSSLGIPMDVSPPDPFVEFDPNLMEVAEPDAFDIPNDDPYSLPGDDEPGPRIILPGFLHAGPSTLSRNTRQRVTSVDDLLSNEGDYAAQPPPPVHASSSAPRMSSSIDSMLVDEPTSSGFASFEPPSADTDFLATSEQASASIAATVHAAAAAPQAPPPFSGAFPGPPPSSFAGAKPPSAPGPESIPRLPPPPPSPGASAAPPPPAGAAFPSFSPAPAYPAYGAPPAAYGPAPAARPGAAAPHFSDLLGLNSAPASAPAPTMGAGSVAPAPKRAMGAPQNGLGAGAAKKGPPPSRPNYASAPTSAPSPSAVSQFQQQPSSYPSRPIGAPTTTSAANVDLLSPVAPLAPSSSGASAMVFIKPNSDLLMEMANAASVLKPASESILRDADNKRQKVGSEQPGARRSASKASSMERTPPAEVRNMFLPTSPRQSRTAIPDLGGGGGPGIGAPETGNAVNFAKSGRALSPRSALSSEIAPLSQSQSRGGSVASRGRVGGKERPADAMDVDHAPKKGGALKDRKEKDSEKLRSTSSAVEKKKEESKAKKSKRRSPSLMDAEEKAEEEFEATSPALGEDNDDADISEHHDANKDNVALSRKGSATSFTFARAASASESDSSADESGEGGSIEHRSKMEPESEKELVVPFAKPPKPIATAPVVHREKQESAPSEQDGRSSRKNLAFGLLKKKASPDGDLVSFSDAPAEISAIPLNRSSSLKNLLSKAAKAEASQDKRAFLQALLGVAPIKANAEHSGAYADSWTFDIHSYNNAEERKQYFAFMKSEKKQFQTWRVMPTHPEAGRFISSKYNVPLLTTDDGQLFRRRWQDLYPGLSPLKGGAYEKLRIGQAQSLVMGLCQSVFDLYEAGLVHLELGDSSFGYSEESLKANRVILTSSEAIRSLGEPSSFAKQHHVALARLYAAYPSALEISKRLCNRAAPLTTLIWYPLITILETVSQLADTMQGAQDDPAEVSAVCDLCRFMFTKLSCLDESNTIQIDEFKQLMEEFSKNGRIDLAPKLAISRVSGSSASYSAYNFSNVSVAKLADALALATASVRIRQHVNTIKLLGNQEWSEKIASQHMFACAGNIAWVSQWSSLSLVASASRDESVLNSMFIYVMSAKCLGSEVDEVQAISAVCSSFGSF